MLVQQPQVGSWTPVIGGSGGTSGQTYTAQVGRYAKWGQLVVIQAYAALSAKGTITGNVQLQGLPFTSLNVANAYCALHLEWLNMTTALVFCSAQVQPGTTSAYLEAATAATASLSLLVTGDVSNTTTLIIGGSYISDT